ncbi:MAG: hypothetical protein IJC45_09570 [Clostridia bacterium]|nr:hypothetical protein [Clostridia bacterium]
MVKLLVGGKGSGKTKRLIECVNNALAVSEGNVICIEKEELLRYQLSYRVRLVSTDIYGISGYNAFYGLLCGICAGDHDITDILVDATLKIGGKDYDELAVFFEKVSRLSSVSETNFVFTVSTDVDNLPQKIKDCCEII